MSTISDALKKAQRTRMVDAPRPSAPAPHAPLPAHEPSASSSPATPDKTLIMVILVVVLGLCLSFFMRREKMRHEAPPVPQMKSDPGMVPPVAAVSTPETGKIEVAKAIPVTVEVAVTNTAVDTPKVEEPVTQVPPPVLGGIFYSEQNPVVILDGFALKEGETVGPFRVVKILPRSVILKSSSGDVELRVK